MQHNLFARLDGVDILINNVGGSSAPSGGALALSDENWQQTFNANLFYINVGDILCISSKELRKSNEIAYWAVGKLLSLSYPQSDHPGVEFETKRFCAVQR